ncbi:MAG: dethiobiotin synthase [Deltaproteobacteria bacterium]
MIGRFVLVVGTGTDVGKTHVSASLVARAHEWARVAGYKPIATGLGPGDRDGDDARRLAEVAHCAPEPVAYGYAEPVSPHLASRIEGRPIDLKHLVVSIERLAAAALDLLIVESAGGLFTPLTDQETNADLARALMAHFASRVVLLIVAPDRIGVLHDLGATVRAARAEGLMLPVVALSAPAVADESTGRNANEILRLGLATTVVDFPRSAPTSVSSRAAATRCLEALGVAPTAE